MRAVIGQLWNAALLSRKVCKRKVACMSQCVRVLIKIDMRS